jgi:hypothetical protein
VLIVGGSLNLWQLVLRLERLISGNALTGAE